MNDNEVKSFLTTSLRSTQCPACKCHKYANEPFCTACMDIPGLPAREELKDAMLDKLDPGSSDDYRNAWSHIMQIITGEYPFCEPEPVGEGT